MTYYTPLLSHYLHNVDLFNLFWYLSNKKNVTSLALILWRNKFRT